MKTNRPQRLGLVVCLAAMIALAVPTMAGDAAGSPQSIDPEVRRPLMRALDKRGYISNRETMLDVAISAYLWDHRHRLSDLNVPKEREVDLVLCLLGQGDRTLEIFATDGHMLLWCHEQVR